MYVSRTLMNTPVSSSLFLMHKKPMLKSYNSHWCELNHISDFISHYAGADPGFDQGGGQIVTGLKLPFWGLSFLEFWCWGLIFGGQGGARAPPLDPPLLRTLSLET